MPMQRTNGEPRRLLLVRGEGEIDARQVRALFADSFTCRETELEQLVARDVQLADLVLLSSWRDVEQVPHLRELLERSRPVLWIGVTGEDELAGPDGDRALAFLRRLPRVVLTFDRDTESAVRALVGGPVACAAEAAFGQVHAALLAEPLEPALATSLVVAGQQALQRQATQAALALWHNALDANPECATTHALLAQLWWDLGEHATALGHQRRAVVLGERDPAATQLVADLLLTQGQTSAAEQLVRDFAIRHPELANLAAVRPEPAMV